MRSQSALSLIEGHQGRNLSRNLTAVWLAVPYTESDLGPRNSQPRKRSRNHGRVLLAGWLAGRYHS